MRADSPVLMFLALVLLGIIAMVFVGCATPKGHTCRCDAAHPGASHRWVVCEVDLSVPPKCVRCEDLVTGKERPCQE